ncbi:hypothetical protein HMPREF9630_00207 [Peptoanaerobacter stomatis]|uniref:PF10934 family protein n=1 Tax=Peptoanaerobacter stomatis TaxID=796937 RepID=V9HSI8_9FIRM|nr:DUF2634 domain-containing protein [Peptoanaerobacter stomatis]EHL18482.1 hypothetical protein HMPREF9630_00207 [Peptoanaerobacter stomatis]
MFPLFEENIEEIAVEENNSPKWTFLVDFKEKKFLKKNGKLIKSNDVRTARMWIEKILLTFKDKYKIYEDYGMSYYDLIIGRRFPIGFLYAELKREIEETMLSNPQIISIENFNAELIKHSLYVTFDVYLVDGSNFSWEAYL